MLKNIIKLGVVSENLNIFGRIYEIKAGIDGGKR